MMVNDIMLHHILDTNLWKRPVYIAVTVPDRRDLENQTRMEGLVFRIYKEPVQSPMDVAKLRENLEGKYHYRGFLKPNGDWDDTVYKDEQATRLLQNYAAARVRLAEGLAGEGRIEEARAQLGKIGKFAAYFPGVEEALGMTYEALGMSTAATEYYEDLLKKNPNDAGALGALGHVKAQQGDTAGAIESLTQALKLDPKRDVRPYAILASIYFEQGRIETAVQVLETWLTYYPGDTKVRNYVDALKGAVRNAASGQPSGATP
jgi:tetratricopeptide (TPR) repeat protein